MKKLSRLSWITTALILIAGFLFLHFKIVDYGGTFFMLFPLAVGFSIGTHQREKQGFYSLIFGVLIFFGFLLAGALEGLICVAMASPLFFIMIWIGHKIQKSSLKRNPMILKN